VAFATVCRACPQKFATSKIYSSKLAALAYGVSGDLPQAEATFAYGVTKDPKYPMFYYNLACVSAERGDEDKTMDFLRQAFSHRADGIAGEAMPDPAHDDSFQKFMSDERFRRFVDSLNVSK
jgi:hypothetical protein